MSDRAEKAVAHGAVVTHPTDRHARKRTELADAEAALRKVQEARNGAAREAEAAAGAALDRVEAARARGQALRDQVDNFARLSAEYQQLAEETAEQVVDQELAIAAAVRDAASAAERARELLKPFRRQEVPLERRIEALRKRLDRAERRS